MLWLERYRKFDAALHIEVLQNSIVPMRST